MLIFQIRSGGVTAKTKASTPTPNVTAWLETATRLSAGRFPVFSQCRRYTSFTMAEEDEIKSDETVEIDAAMGPMMAAPAKTGGNVPTMDSGMILSTLPPYAARSSVRTPAASTPSDVTPIIMAPMMTVPMIMARCSDFVSL